MRDEVDGRSMDGAEIVRDEGEGCETRGERVEGEDEAERDEASDGKARVRRVDCRRVEDKVRLATLALQERLALAVAVLLGRRRRSGRSRCARTVDFGVASHEERDEDLDSSDCCVGREDGSVGLLRGLAVAFHAADDDARQVVADADSEEAEDLVPHEETDTALWLGQPAQHGLLECGEGSSLVSAWRNDPDDGGDEEDDVVAREGERNARSAHQERSQREHATAAECVGSPCDEEREEDVAEESRREEETDRSVGKANLAEKDDEDRGEGAEAVCCKGQRVGQAES